MGLTILQSSSNKPLKFVCTGGVDNFYWYQLDKTTSTQHCVNPLAPGKFE